MGVLQSCNTAVFFLCPLQYIGVGNCRKIVGEVGRFHPKELSFQWSLEPPMFVRIGLSGDATTSVIASKFGVTRSLFSASSFLIL